MKKILFIIALTITVMASCSKKANEGEPTTQAQALITRLDNLRQRGYMYAHQDDPFYGVTWQWERDRSDTYELVGDYPAVMGFDLGGIEMGDAKNLDSVPFTWIREEAIKHVERGGIITFSWHPRNPRTGGTAWDVADTTVVRNVLPGGEQHEKFIGWLDAVTSFLKTITYEDGTPMPFILRPWHEYNGSWFWWGQKLCSDDEFKAFFRMTYDHIAKQLPTNIVWSCSPNLQGYWTEEMFLSRWPGDDIIDLVGEDCYQWGSEEDFIRQATADILFLSNYAKEHGKLFAVTECGMQNSPVADWWTRVFQPVIEQAYLPCYFLPWRNWYDGHFGASKDVCTADDFKKLYAQPNTLFLKDIQE
ncbi:MAG: beta-mannosidase [Bacteroidales bacterium]|nr:beta-mannosidase [Bacteroidales bacterium]